MTNSPLPSTSGRFFIRFSSKEDIEKVSDFYDMNAHKGVRKRRMDVLTELCTNGSIVLAENEDGKIVGASISYPHATTDADGIERVKWVEVGSTRIVANGYSGLFDILVAMQLLRSYMVEPPEDRFVAQMHTKPVQGLAENIGWRRFDGHEELHRRKVSTVESTDHGGVLEGNWFHLGVEGLPSIANVVVGLLDNPVLKHRKTGEGVAIDFSATGFIKMFEQNIRALATRDYGSLEKPDMKKGIADHRLQWLRRHIR